MTSRALRRLRKGRGLSVAKAAALVHVAPRTWVRWESGEVSVPEIASHLFALLMDVPYRPSKPPS